MIEIKIENKELETKLTNWYNEAQKRHDYKGTLSDYVLILLADELDTLSLMP